jgi:hypothetical protein
MLEYEHTIKGWTMTRLSRFQVSALCIIFPIILGSIVYMGFISNYSIFSFTPMRFMAVYTHGFFEHRILGTTLTLKLYAFLSTHIMDRQRISFPTIFSIKGQTDILFYYSQVIVNTVSLIGTSFVLCYIACQPQFSLSRDMQCTLIIILQCIIALTQFVLTPYDNLLYFWIMLSFALSLSDIKAHNANRLYPLIILMFLGTITHEASAIILSIYTFLYLKEFGFSYSDRLIHLGILIATYLLSYFGVYFFLAIPHDTYLNNMVAINRAHYIRSLCSLAFLFFFCFLFCHVYERLKNSLLFLLLCLPYLIFVSIVGELWEMRLWVPVLLPLLFLIHYQTSDKACAKVSTA